MYEGERGEEVIGGRLCASSISIMDNEDPFQLTMLRVVSMNAARAESN